jgi:hypothetical protein
MFPSSWSCSWRGCWLRAVARSAPLRNHGVEYLAANGFTLAWFRDRPDIARLGRGFGISQATAYRYLDEAIAVLAAKAPDRHEALDHVEERGLSHLVLDGKVAADVSTLSGEPVNGLVGENIRFPCESGVHGRGRRGG